MRRWSPTASRGRCGVGPRQPLLVVSPFAKTHYVDGTFTGQGSILRLTEDTWLGGERIGGGAADAQAGTPDNMFTWRARGDRRLFLDPSTGEPVHGRH